MKTKILILCAIVFLSKANAQNSAGESTTEGSVIYEEIAKLEIRLEGDAAQFADQIPKEQVSQKILYFNPDNSLYKLLEAANNEDVMPQTTGHMTVRMKISGGSDKIFCDMKNRKKIEQKEFMTRMFLIDGELARPEWKITGNQKMISGYNCQEATCIDNGRKISAWFFPSIPVSAGPAGFGDLPGLILMVDIENGKRIITAKTITPKLDDAGILEIPKEGKKVSQEEYKKMVDEKMKEMGEESLNLFKWGDLTAKIRVSV
jgi:GLPGLI family protein